MKTLSTDRLIFAKANAKLRKLADNPAMAQWLEHGRKVYSLDLLAGHSCPFADACLAKVILDEATGKKRIDEPVKDDESFRCFSATEEAVFPATYRNRKHNFDLLRQARYIDSMHSLLEHSMPEDLGILRIHSSGDCFNANYFKALCYLAWNHPLQLFYGYTKSLKYLVEFKALIPNNLVWTASYGGKLDSMIEEHALRFAKVIFHPSEANGLEIDHDDSHAALPSLRDKSFALLIHGHQQKGSKAAKALKTLKLEKIEYAYR